MTVDISVVCCLYAVMLGHFLGLRILGNLIYSEGGAIGLQFVIFILKSEEQASRLKFQIARDSTLETFF